MSAEDHRTPAEGMPRWVPLSVDLSVPAFDEIVNPDAPHESAPAPQTPAPEVPASQPTLPQENHASRGRVEMSQAKPELPIVPTLPATARVYDLDATAPAGIPLGAAAAEAAAETSAAKSPSTPSPSRIPAPHPKGFAEGAVVGGAAAAEGVAATAAARVGHAGASFAGSGHSGGTGGGNGGGRGEGGRAQGSPTSGGESAERGIDPTRPTIIFAAVLTVLATIWAGATVLSPVKHSGVDDIVNQAKSASPSASASAQPSDNPSQTTTVTPVISSVSVLSWKDDKGDHEEMAVNMIDGDAKTSWHSRYFDYNQFLDDTAVTVLVKFEKKSTVSEITLTMDPSTSGGEGVVRAVDPNSPRAGTEIATTTFSPTTDIKLAHPVETDAISITFRKMPTSQDGRAWAWISELSVK